MCSPLLVYVAVIAFVIAVSVIAVVAVDMMDGEECAAAYQMIATRSAGV